VKTEVHFITLEIYSIVHIIVTVIIPMIRS